MAIISTMLTLYKQTDPRWSRVRLGLPWITIGAAGCADCCVAMIATYVAGYPITPDKIASNRSWFNYGNILWDKLKIPHLQFTSREYGRNDRNIIHAINDNPNTFVMLQVKTAKIKEHWLWAIAVDGNDYKVADPLYGDECNLAVRYGWHVITGAAYFKKI